MLQPTDDKAFLAAYTQARVYLMQNPNWAFYSALLMLLDDTKEDAQEQTVSVDGKNLYINKEFLTSIESKPKRATVLAHEAMHVALKHPVRIMELPEKLRPLYNEAADHVVNLMLKDDGFEPPFGPDVWYCDDRFKDMTTEQVFKILQMEQPPQPEEEPDNGDGEGQPPPPGMGQDVRPPAIPKEGDGSGATDQHQAMAQLSGEIDVMLRQAEQQAISQGMKPGDIPGMVRDYLDSLMKPKLPMSSHLRSFMTQLSRDDYSWRRINRRFHPMILPGLQAANKLQHIAFWYDMSGSVSREDFTRYQSEVVGVMRNMKPDKITIGQFDTRVKQVDVVKNLRDMAKMEFHGRGGTNIECVMEWAKENKPAALVVFSDGEFRHPSFNPGCPVLWMIHGYSKDRYQCDFGKIIRFDV